MNDTNQEVSPTLLVSSSGGGVNEAYHDASKERRGMLYRVLGNFSWITTYHQQLLSKATTKSKIIIPRRTRIRRRTRRRCLAMIITFFTYSSNNNNKSLAFSLKGLSIKRRQQQQQQQRLRIPSTNTATTTTSKGFAGNNKFPFPAVVMNAQSNENSSNSSDEIPPDNQEEEEENDNNSNNNNNNNDIDQQKEEIKNLKKMFTKRITRLEDIVSRQEVDIHRLKNTCAELSEISEAFTRVLQLLREAGLDADTIDNAGAEVKRSSYTNNNKDNKSDGSLVGKVIESYDDAMIFGTVPSSVIDAADAAGAAILAAMLGGKQRMLIDVRDAELSSDPETLVQFIELAILPIAAGLEGLNSTRNRVKIVFPKVSQLLEYRRTMALAAPEVVALSTLGFDPVEKRDKLVVIVAPAPDDEEGIQAIKELLTPSEDGVHPIQKPVVILNYHMLPFTGVDLDFETAYHLRLLAVQYMADSQAEEFFEQQLKEDGNSTKDKDDEKYNTDIDTDNTDDVAEEENDDDDEALESAMKHAHEVGANEGITRAMVIRAYPRPWHVFVDLSPDTDSDFEVAATFDKEPTMDQVNLAIIECLEGSEREDEIVAKQMQQALEDGQLNQVSGMISDTLSVFDVDDDDISLDDDDDDDDDISLDDDEEDDFDMYEEDSV
jgi:hypothetical protein